MDAQNHGTLPSLAAPDLAHRLPADLPPLGTAAAHAAVTSSNEKALDAANVGGPLQTEPQYLTFEQPTDDGKRFATLRALLALKGHVLSRTHADNGPVRFYVTRWGLIRELPNIAAVRAFAEQVGAIHA